MLKSCFKIGKDLHSFQDLYSFQINQKNGEVTFVSEIVHVLCQWELNTLPNPSVHPTLLPLIIKSNQPFPLPNMAK